MLVLSRHVNEAIVIGDDIHIVVVSIREDKVRLGIEAPKHVPVHRREVYDAITSIDPPAVQGEDHEPDVPETSPPPPPVPPAPPCGYAWLIDRIREEIARPLVAPKTLTDVGIAVGREEFAREMLAAIGEEVGR